MAAPTGETIYAGGRLILNPSDNSDPDSGTEAGDVHECRVRTVERSAPILAEEYGGEEVEAIYLRTEVFLRFLIVNWDADAFAAQFPGVSAGTTRPIVPIPATSFKPGARMKSRAVKFLWAPTHNGATSEDPGWLAISAYPERDHARVIQFRDSEQASLEVLYRCTRESGDLILKFAALEDQS